MLWVLLLFSLVMWWVGYFTSNMVGGLLHLLLAICFFFALLRLMQRRQRLF